MTSQLLFDNLIAEVGLNYYANRGSELVATNVGATRLWHWLFSADADCRSYVLGRLHGCWYIYIYIRKVLFTGTRTCTMSSAILQINRLT